MTPDLLTVLAALGVGIVSVLVGLGLMRALHLRHGAAVELIDRTVEPTVLLFRKHRLIDATAPARALLAGLAGGDEWQRLTAHLAMRFPEFGMALETARQQGLATTHGALGHGSARLRLTIEDLGDDLMRLTLADPSAENAGITIDSQSLAQMESELAVLRHSIDNAPVLIWHEDRGGDVTWANAAYLQEVEAQSPDDTLWPMPRLIDVPAQDGDTGTPRRAQMPTPDGARWYDCHVRTDGDGRMIFAVPADAAVRAERSLREFVQTLTKTFADLPIGLAIFDRQRHLQLFNPALIDLTSLEAGFLTARPTLYAFLDRLREARMVPEPKDYRSWRNKMATLEAAAASGHHVETWSLPGGQTYRVTGRPHPDGAVAFLFEDITSEMSLTRRFRAELSLGYEVLDMLDDALAVFDAGGRIITSNARYAEQWGVNPPQTLAEHFALWGAAAPDGPALHALRDAMTTIRDRSVRRGAIAGPQGGLMGWTVRPLSGARALVIFSTETPARALAAAESTQAPSLPPPLRPAASQADAAIAPAEDAATARTRAG